MCTRRMRRNVVRAGARWGFMAWVIVIGPAYADPLDVSCGSYPCVVHRTVGLQSDATKRERFAGAIKQPVEAERLLLKIAPINNDERTWCQKAKAGVQSVRDEYDLWWKCKSTSEVTFSQGKNSMPLRSDDIHIFRERLGGWLHIIKGLKYTYAYPDYSGNFYLEERVCQKQ